MLLHRMKHQLKLELLPQQFSVCRLPADATIPQWVLRSAVFSLTRTADELSIVCESRYVPSSVKSEKGWRCFKLKGPFPFAMTGVLESVLAPLATARVSIFAVSTFDTDYVMVSEKQLAKAVKTLHAVEHHILTD